MENVLPDNIELRLINIRALTRHGTSINITQGWANTQSQFNFAGLYRFVLKKHIVNS